MSTIDWEHILPVADDALFAAGALLAMGTLVYWLARVRRDPLGAVPHRANWLMLDGMLVPVCVWLLAGSLAAMWSERVSGGRLDLLRLVTDNAAPLLGGLACIWIGARCFKGGSRAFLLGDGRLFRPATIGGAYMLASMAVCPLIYHGTVHLLRSLEPTYPVFDHEVVEALRTGETCLWALWAGTAVIAPVAEECFFRGVLQSGLSNIVKNRWLAVILTAAIFGAVHAGGGDSPQPHVVPALTALGVMLGVLYMRTGSLVGPIVLHALFNIKTLLWESLLSAGG